MVCSTCVFQTLGVLVLAKVAFSVISGALSRFVKRRDVRKMGEWAVVTGATDGIGKATSIALAQKGMNVVLISRNQQRLDEAAIEVQKAAEAKGKKIETKTISIDFSSTDDSIYETIRAQTASLNVGVLVNNVGISYPHAQYFNEVSNELVNNLIDINIRSAFKMTHIFYGPMRDRKRGIIVNVASAAATLPSDPLYAGYAGAKAALVAFSNNLAVEAAESGVVVQVHAPLLIPSKLSKVRHASFFSPSPKTYAAAAIQAMENRMHSDCPISPYIGHELQMLVAWALPRFVWDKVRFGMTKGIRKAAMKKAEREAAAAKQQ